MEKKKINVCTWGGRLRLCVLALLLSMILPMKSAGHNSGGEDDDYRIYTVADKKPSFKGNLEEWLAVNLRYPVPAAVNHIEGRVIVRFVVGKDGNIAYAYSLVGCGADPALNAEALRVVDSMPAWNPGMKSGKPVNVWSAVAINFDWASGCTGDTNISAEEMKKTLEREVDGSGGMETLVQDPTPASQAHSSTPKFEIRETDSVFTLKEYAPRFRGNVNAWLSSNLCYPEASVKNRVQGKVIVKFCVCKDGSIDNVQIVQSVDPLLDAEALRVIRAMPKWMPGINETDKSGSFVSVWMTLPINFKL